MESLIIAVIFFWLIIISWLLVKTRNHYLLLTKTTRKQKLDEILEKLIEDDKKLTTQTEELKKQLSELTDNSNFYYQKFGLVRYNAFEKTGGEQSFVIALLNKKNTGMILNFIYTRDGLRVYTKNVREGKGELYDLSAEERKAIETSK